MWTVTRTELFKIFSRPRTYIGFIAIGLLVAMIQIALFVDGNTYLEFSLQNLKEAFEFQGELLNGYLSSYIVLATLYIHIPFLVALVTGDLVAGEAASGTLRIMLTRPVTRTSFILGKFLAGMIYTSLLILCMAAVSLIMGVAIMGTGDLIVVRNTVYIFNESDVMWRLVAAFGFGLAAMWTVAALSFMFSVFADNSIGPIVLTMTVIISFIVISAIDLSIFNAMDPFLFTNYMSDWKLFFESPVDFGRVTTSLLILCSHTALFILIANLYFNKKDILT